MHIILIPITIPMIPYLFWWNSHSFKKKHKFRCFRIFNFPKISTAESRVLIGYAITTQGIFLSLSHTINISPPHSPFKLLKYFYVQNIKYSPIFFLTKNKTRPNFHRCVVFLLCWNAVSISKKLYLFSTLSSISVWELEEQNLFSSCCTICYNLNVLNLFFSEDIFFRVVLQNADLEHTLDTIKKSAACSGGRCCQWENNPKKKEFCLFLLLFLLFNFHPSEYFVILLHPFNLNFSDYLNVAVVALNWAKHYKF